MCPLTRTTPAGVAIEPLAALAVGSGPAQFWHFRMLLITTHRHPKPDMFEILAQIFILALIVAFSFAAIAGNAMRHAQENASTKRRSTEGAAEKLAPRIFALSPVRTQETTKAA